MSKKMYLILSAVLLFHMVFFGTLFMMQGCRTTASKSSTDSSAEILMPPTKEAVEAPYIPPTPPPRTSKKAEESPTTIPPKEVGASEYVVQKGDTLGIIAKKHGVTITELKDVNKIKDPNKIRIGQKLVIPASNQTKIEPIKTDHIPKAVSSHKESKSSIAVSLAKNEYIVQPGDSLSKIAAKHGVKISDLKQANKLTTDKVKIGQKLIIPEKVSSPEKSKVTSTASEKKTTEPTKATATTESQEMLNAPTSTPESSKNNDSSATTPSNNKTSEKSSLEPAPSASASSPSASVIQDAKGYSFEHIVRPDDDLNKIARMYATKVEDIIALNNLGTNPNLTVGQKIKIPNL